MPRVSFDKLISALALGTYCGNHWCAYFASDGAEQACEPSLVRGACEAVTVTNLVAANVPITRRTSASLCMFVHKILVTAKMSPIRQSNADLNSMSCISK